MDSPLTKLKRKLQETLENKTSNVTTQTRALPKFVQSTQFGKGVKDFLEKPRTTNLNTNTLGRLSNAYADGSQQAKSLGNFLVSKSNTPNRSGPLDDVGRVAAGTTGKLLNVVSHPLDLASKGISNVNQGLYRGKPQQSAYGLGQTLTAGGALYKGGQLITKGGPMGILGRAGQGATLNLLMNTGATALTQRRLPTRQEHIKAAQGGIENSWTLALTNAVTNKVLSKFAPKLTGTNITAPFAQKAYTEGFKRVFTRALAEVPAENTAFTWLNRLDGDTQREFIEDWLANLPGATAQNLLFAGAQGTYNASKNADLNIAANKALVETVRKWNMPVVTMSLDKNGERITAPMWEYKLRQKVGMGLSTKNVRELSEEDFKKQEFVTTQKSSQTPKISKQPLTDLQSSPQAIPQVPKPTVVPTVNPSSKYAFNINKPKLNLSKSESKNLDNVVEKMRPVLEARKGKPLTNQEIIKGGRKAKLLNEVMSRDESKEFSEALQASRNFLKSEAGQKGLTPQFLAQLEIVSSHASDKGRSLRAFATNAEDATIKESVVRDLQKLGIETKRLIEASKSVDWDDAKQVTEFYRKFKPANFAEKLEEYRYTNMLSSPSTHITNVFGNVLQSGVVTPIEKTLTGSLDFVKSRLTGSEQQYFTKQGVDYATGYWKSLPDGWKKFREVMSGQGGLTKPDVDFIPTGTGRLHKVYTTPLRALEASDQFFRTMVMGGETKALARTNLTDAQILRKAEESADYRLFRQKFDPEGKLGQGGVLKIWDRWNSGINQLRQLPGGKWVVPFLQTPTNILKQGVEYSPLGVTTIPGSKEPMEQLSKAMLGTGVFMGAYALADAGLTTWDTPINKKERDAFLAAGLQPYSVKIGDKWVSYSKLGPISYPIAMASAMKWAEENGTDDTKLETVAKGAGGFLQFFADQSYMQGIGDIIDAARGDDYKQGRALANIPSQLVPYRAFLGWVSRLVDPVYRKSSGGGVASQAYKSVISQIPFASKSLEAYTTPTGEESKRHLPITNALSPLKMTQEDPEHTQLHEWTAKAAKNTRTESKIEKELEESGGTEKTEDKIYYWDEESESVKSLPLNWDTSSSSDPVTKIRSEQKRFDEALKIYRDEGIPEDIKAEALSKSGISETDLSYYDIASDDNNVRRVFVEEYLYSLKDTEDPISALGELRRSIKDQRVLTDTLIDDLVDDELITKTEGQRLKAVQYDEKAKSFIQKKKSGKKLSLSAPPKITKVKIQAPAKMPVVNLSRSGSSPKLDFSPTQRKKQSIKLKKLSKPKLSMSGSTYGSV